MIASHTQETVVYLDMAVAEWEAMAKKAKEHLDKTQIGQSRTFLKLITVNEGHIEIWLGVCGEEKTGIV